MHNGRQHRTRRKRELQLATLTFHIGSPKTGTTSLQNLLTRNAANLRDQGWVYPDFFGYPNHLRLGLAFLDSTDIRLERKYKLEDRAKAIDEIDQLLTDQVQPDQRWLMSAESAAWMSPAEIASLLDFLSRHFTKVEAVVYFRRQEFMIVSNHSQHIKLGHAGNMDLESTYLELGATSPVQVYANWSKALGADSVRARPYLEKFKSDPAALIADFCDTVGITVDASDGDEPQVRQRNTGLSAEAIEMMRVLDAQVPLLTDAGERGQRLRQRTIRKLLKHTKGPSLQIPDSLVPAIRAAYEPDNQRLVEQLGGGAEWVEWLDQSPYVGAGDAPAPMPPERVIELMRVLSYPRGPIDLRQESWTTAPKKRRRWLNKK